MRDKTNRDSSEGILRVAGGVTKSIDVARRTVRAVLSSETVDRYGDVILASSFNTPENFRNYFDGNPILCWAHNQDCTRNLPIGVVKNPTFNEFDMNTNLAFTGDAVFAEIADAEDVWQLYKGEFLRAFSVGFRPIEVSKEPVKDLQTGLTFKKVDLLENSAVPIPANPAAMRRAFTEGVVSEEFMHETFFRMRDTVLTRNMNLFIPTDWKYKESCNEIAIMEAEVRTAGFREMRRKIDASRMPPPVVKEMYLCHGCDKESEVVMAEFEDKTFKGSLSEDSELVYKNVICEHCKMTTEQCIEAVVEILSSNSQ